MSNLLDISTFVERSHVTIDGEQFELRNREELGIVDDHKLAAIHRRVTKLYEQDDLSTEDAAGMVEQMGEFLGIVSPTIPVEKLTDSQKLAIIAAWAKQYQKDDEEPAVEGEGETNPT